LRAGCCDWAPSQLRAISHVRLHHSFNDPAAVEGTDEKRLDHFRKVRDELRAYLKEFPKND